MTMFISMFSHNQDVTINNAWNITPRARPENGVRGHMFVLPMQLSSPAHITDCVSTLRCWITTKSCFIHVPVSSFLLLRRCYCQVAIPSSPLSSLFRSPHTFRINGCPHECRSNFCWVYGLSSSLFLPSLDLSSLTAAVMLSLWLMRLRMLVSVITSLSRSLMKRLLCLASSSWLLVTRDSN